MKNLILSTCFIMASTAASAASISNFSVCFSPSGGCDTKLVSFIKAAHTSIDIAIYDLTLPNLAQAIVAQKTAGVKVRIVADRSEAKTKTSLIRKLIQSGAPVRFGNVQGIMHNKFVIVDDRMLETGSFNYSLNATHANAENQLYLDSPEVVSQYQAQFEKLWAEGLPTPK